VEDAAPRLDLKLTPKPSADVTELTADQLSSVTGGRKAGKLQHEFLIVKMNDVLITGVT
jgi:hypothetical protein